MTNKTRRRDHAESVTVTQAALAARVHVTNIYKVRTKLQAFKHAGQWRIPNDALAAYIKERRQRAQEILGVLVSTEKES